MDGDTVVFDSGERLRVPSVDCPEVGRLGAEEAREWTQRFLDRLGRNVRSAVKTEGPRDRYGRLLMDVTWEGESLSNSLLSAGLAWVYRSHDPDLLAIQARAVEQRQGVHVILDHAVADGPFVLTATSFHRPSCGLIRKRTAELPWSARAIRPFTEGKAPCRRCLSWPPWGPLGGPDLSGSWLEKI